MSTTAAISVAALQAAILRCTQAIEDGDSATAWTNYQAAEAINAGLELSAGADGASVQRRTSLNGLREALTDTSSVATTSASDDRRLIRTRVSRG